MKISGRINVVSKKLRHYADELAALREAGVAYKIGFAILLVILLPVLLVEVVILIIFGADMGMFASLDAVKQSIFIEEEVPEILRDLIPLAKKYGISDDVGRDKVMKNSSTKELSEIVSKVVPKAQEIADWLETYPEDGISDTASYFLYLGSACDEVSMYIARNET